MTDTKQEKIAKSLLETFRIVWCDRGTDFPPYFNCSVCEFEDGDCCRLKLFIANKDKHETEYPQGMIAGGDEDDER